LRARVGNFYKKSIPLSKPIKQRSVKVQVMNECCCGIDVHKKMIVACLLKGKAGEEPKKTIRRFPTMTCDLLRFRDWLLSEACTHVAMESTSVYWKPVFNIIEDCVEVILGNAREIKNVPGRKTDIKDCQWIAALLRHGLIKASFIPPKPIRELRDLTRYRHKLIQCRSSEINRIQKNLEDANIKLSSVVTDITGKSAQEMILHLIKKDMAPKQMADLAKGRLRKKVTELEKALQGNVKDHQRLILQISIQMISYYDLSIEKLNREIDKRMEPYQKEVELLRTIPGVQKKTSEVIIAEIGTDMSRFPSERHLSSWAGLSPGNNESAGKRKSGKTTKGNIYLKSILTESSWAVSRAKDTYLQARYKRLSFKRGKKRAAIAIGHSILVSTYYIIKDHRCYVERGANFFDRSNELKLLKNLTKRIQKLGYRVETKKNMRKSA